MASLEARFGGWQMRLYSSVNITNGSPLGIDSNGKQIRKQQSICICPVSETAKKATSPEVLKAMAHMQEQIAKWEAAAETYDVTQEIAKDITIAAFFAGPFSRLMRGLTAATQKSYAAYWRAYLGPHFGGLRFTDYNATTASRFLRKLGETLSYNTVSHCRAVASAIFAHAITEGVITSVDGKSANPWRDAEIVRKVKCQKAKPTRAYTINEIEKILSILDNVGGRETYSAKVTSVLVAACFYAGLRPSEAAGLRWENVELEAGVLHVRNVFVVGEFCEGRTKTTDEAAGKDGFRDLVLLPQLKSRLLLWNKENGSPATGWVFPNSDNSNPININDMSSRILKKHLAANGMEWSGLYACRRGFGTVLYDMVGCSLEEISSAMGNSETVCKKHYVKAANAAGARAIQKWAAAQAPVLKEGRFMRQPALSGVGEVLEGEVSNDE